MPIESKTNITLFNDNQFKNVHASLARVFHLATTIIVNYTISNTHVEHFYSVERNGGMFYAAGSIDETG